MTVEKKTIGQAIDEIVAALSALDEKARSTAVVAACAHLGIESPIPAGTSGAPAATQTPSQQVTVSSPNSVKDVRTLKDEKQPDNAKEMACVVAYYLQNHAPQNERRDVVTADDMVKYFKQAHFPLPKRITQLLIDARHSGYFDPAERSKYRLNAVGYNLVAHTLPRTKKTV